MVDVFSFYFFIISQRFKIQVFFSFKLVFQVFMESYDRFLEFLKRSKAVSPTLALETATALQVMS